MWLINLESFAVIFCMGVTGLVMLGIGTGRIAYVVTSKDLPDGSIETKHRLQLDFSREARGEIDG